ncbi:uncharacterized protein LOC123525650 [Mercenaria mercenaria]|uniref:uncharacterized protein LOC123525650 n=1 Tax=Mercenaria mercenaria TaxID=6596 RepID=UPI00234E52BB|nr:uncharacterized protein LOC123525650 [Mercenaria mercenaria]
MSQDIDYYRNVSLRLSEVLSDISVTENIVLKRRRMMLLQETMATTKDRLMGKPTSTYIFGSQSEGSTTLGLKSDYDILHCCSDFNIIQDWAQWQPGVKNLLMIQDETTSPGYCLLQKVRADESLPAQISLIVHEAVHKENHLLTVSGDRVLLKNTVPTFIFKELPGAVRKQGPALTQTIRGFHEHDFVLAFPCETWPVEAQPWLIRQGKGRWPTEEMKRYCKTTGCFVVAVGSKNGQYEEHEWRISTSLAERCLMFSLNITQLRCYILMKMILKTFINPQCDGVLSSFICKTVLFYCIQNKRSNVWQENNLLACLNCCLLALLNCVRQENCPHFIIHGNNLMAGKISSSNKHKLLEILQLIIQSEGGALLEIPIDGLGLRVKEKFGMRVKEKLITLQNELISLQLLYNTAKHVTLIQKDVLMPILPCENEMVQQKLSDYIFTLARIYWDTDVNSLQKTTCRLLTPSLCSSLASVIASNDIYANNTVSPVALALFSAGLSSDVSSGRLKLASALYCTGDIIGTEFVLRNTEHLYDLNIVEPVCACICIGKEKIIRTGFAEKSTNGNEELIRHVTAHCVVFMQYEINCVPQELKYEMFRFSQEEMLERNFLDYWMDWAVVDSLPYLYFLQYKTYSHLQRAAEKHQALTNLVTTINTEKNLGHRETALNLLGQCFEQENRHMDALCCYIVSLNVRPRNNVAKIHIGRLLNVLVNAEII